MKTFHPPNPLVIKIGGALLEEPKRLTSFWQSVKRLHETAPVVIVHGGGPQATAMARRLDHEPRFVHGRRVTTDLDLHIAQWTLRGRINSQLVAQAITHGLTAVGISGADGGLLRVTRRPPWNIDGETVDFGWVGDVDQVKTGLLSTLIQHDFMPIVAPLGTDAAGQLYNVNADTVACVLAEALDAPQLLLVTESGGVKECLGTPGSHLPRCDWDTFTDGMAAGWIGGGMRVKLQAAFEALQAGISNVFILAPDDLLHRTHATQVVL
ncbi:MAG: acetylglutamate kinase [Rhodothermales bacterium]